MVSNRLIQKYFEYTSKEQKDFLITSIILTFILFFFSWRTTDLNILQAVLRLIQFFIITGLSLFAFISASKWFAIQRHYTAHYESWIPAALIGFVVSFTSYGLVPLIFPGLITIKRIERLRHGKVFPGENKYDIFTILAIAPITSILISIIMQFFFQATKISFFYNFMVFNAALAFFCLLPFGKNIGLHLFYTNKTNYVYLLLFSFSFFLLTIFNVFFSAFFAIIVAIILWLIIKGQLKQFNI